MLDVSDGPGMASDFVLGPPPDGVAAWTTSSRCWRAVRHVVRARGISCWRVVRPRAGRAWRRWMRILRRVAGAGDESAAGRLVDGLAAAADSELAKDGRDVM